MGWNVSATHWELSLTMVRNTRRKLTELYNDLVPKSFKPCIKKPSPIRIWENLAKDALAKGLKRGILSNHAMQLLLKRLLEKVISVVWLNTDLVLTLLILDFSRDVEKYVKEICDR